MKAKVASVAALQRKAEAIADSGPEEIMQEDIFFACERGRLKLRLFTPERGELIFYCRADQAGPKESFYILTPTNHPQELAKSLALAYGEIGRVIKKRTLFLVGRTRIHLDEVEGLGSFLELEVVLKDGEENAIGEREAAGLMNALDVQPEHLIEGAYIDLLARQRFD